MADVWIIDKWVERKVNSFIKYFYPTIVAKETELPLNEVFERLLFLVKDKKLILNWEIRCPDCNYTITTLDEFPTSIPSEIFCEFCQEDVELSLDYIFPVFKIDPKYKKHVKECTKVSKKKKSARLKKMSEGEIQPAAITDTGLYNSSSLALLKELSPGFGELLKGNQGVINIQVNMEENNMSKYDFKGAKLDASHQGQIVIGENQTVSQNVQKTKTATQTLLEELEKIELDSEKKQEMKEAIESAEQQIESQKPNKIVLKGIVDGLQKGMDLITKSPAIITAFESWKTALSSFM
ncbi:hypothetical protein V7055_25940 [Bacillus thuringiensis]|uniref:hypothetical protein n=1 Tax=Bacillus thuringiensis TaxID=1428 RepID=UPI00300257B0